MFICSHECAYCRSSIASGQRWVREKIYETTPLATARTISVITLSSSPELK